jgi:hypothetical protein
MDLNALIRTTEFPRSDQPYVFTFDSNHHVVQALFHKGNEGPTSIRMYFDLTHAGDLFSILHGTLEIYPGPTWYRPTSSSKLYYECSEIAIYKAVLTEEQSTILESVSNLPREEQEFIYASEGFIIRQPGKKCVIRKGIRQYACSYESDVSSFSEIEGILTALSVTINNSGSYIELSE